MTTVHILDRKPRHPLLPVAADWYPVFLNKQRLADMGLKISYFTELNERTLDSDVLLLSSRFFAIHAERGQQQRVILQQLQTIRKKVRRIIWFDFRDSTGNTQFEVLPYVDKYLKKQLLKDRSLYRQKFYGNRIYTDYIHRQFGIQDSYDEPCEPLLPTDEHKIGISWNPGLLDFRGGTRPSLAWQLATDRFASTFKASNAIKWHAPQAPRNVNMLALFNTTYGRQTVAWQRRRVPGILARIRDDKIIYRDKVPLKDEIKARRNSKIVLSLFGWGELCSRDFQTFIAGAALIAPDTTHLETWPATHIPNETYWPIKWDMSDLPEAYHHLITNNEERLHIAAAGQERYKRINSKAGRRDFCVRFLKLLQPEPVPLHR